MQDQFLTYRRFDDLALAEELMATLNDRQIAFELEDDSIRFDPAFTFSETAHGYCVKLLPQDFERVDAMLVEMEQRATDDVDPGYYLFGFTDAELMDVLTNYDEWSKFDGVLARKILAGRGHVVDNDKIQSIKQERIDELQKPETRQTSWIIFGYICAFAGGVLGIFIGWHLSRHKKTLPNGNQVYAYQLSDRQHGSRIFVIGIIIFVCGIAWRAYQVLNLE